MKLLTKSIERKLRANAADPDGNHKPVMKLFDPTGSGTWLISEMDENGMMFGLADLGMGSPELGYIYLPELAEYRGLLGLGIERDTWFKGDKPLSEYADAARAAGRITA